MSGNYFVGKGILISFTESWPGQSGAPIATCMLFAAMTLPLVAAARVASLVVGSGCPLLYSALERTSVAFLGLGLRSCWRP